MTRRRFAIALAVPVLVFVPLFAQTTKSVWTGVYTTEQATRGTDLYQRVCGECHGDDLEGRERSPALAGSSFAERWDGATLKKLFERMQEMPPDGPQNRLTDSQYADVLSFLLTNRGVQTGDFERDVAAARATGSRSHTATSSASGIAAIASK